MMPRPDKQPPGGSNSLLTSACGAAPLLIPIPHCHGSCGAHQWRMVGPAPFISGEIEPSCAAEILNINEILHEAFDYAAGIGMAAENTLGFTDGQHWQTREGIRCLDRRFQGGWPLLIPIASDQDNLLGLAKLP